MLLSVLLASRSTVLHHRCTETGSSYGPSAISYRDPTAPSCSMSDMLLAQRRMQNAYSYTCLWLLLCHDCCAHRLLLLLLHLLLIQNVTRIASLNKPSAAMLPETPRPLCSMMCVLLPAAVPCCYCCSLAPLLLLLDSPVARARSTPDRTSTAVVHRSNDAIVLLRQFS
jgi:hypothetical protein